MMDVSIFDIQRCSFVDGPGIRTVVFFKGCNLRCKWCHNPESWLEQPQIAWFNNRCVHCGACIRICPRKAIDAQCHVDVIRCTACGQCINACPAAARKLYGHSMIYEELMPTIVADREFYMVSGGGVTFSGGECLLQHETLLELLKRCKLENIQTAIDTAGNVAWRVIASVLPWTDWFLYDIKCFSSALHEELTGIGNQRILDNYMHLQKVAPSKIIVRIPIVEGANDNNEEMHRIAEFLSEHPPYSVELLPYHKLGLPKASAIGKTEEEFMPPTETRLRELRELFHSKGVTINAT